MVCARFRGALSALAAGGSASTPLEAHLSACAGCRKELETMRRVLAIADQQLAHLSVAEPSGSFVPRLRAATMAYRHAPRRPAWLWPSLAAAAAVVVAIIRIGSDGPIPAVPAVNDAILANAPSKTPLQDASSDSVAAGKAENSADAMPRPERSARSRHSEPQVLVSPEESRALVEWVALLNRERRSSAALIAAAESQGRVAEPTSIEIQPIEIVPLDSVMQAGT